MLEFILLSILVVWLLTSGITGLVHSQKKRLNKKDRERQERAAIDDAKFWSAHNR